MYSNNKLQNMSERFNGFSQEEIIKVSGNENSIKTNTRPTYRGQHSGIRRMPNSLLTKNLEREDTKSKSMKAIKKSTTLQAQPPDVANVIDDNNDTLSNINIDASMTKSLEDALFYPHLRDQKKDGMQNNEINLSVNEEGLTNPNDDSSILPSSVVEEVFKLNNNFPEKGISLKDFEVHRKFIEEQNRHKKEILHRAIEHHSLKNAAEVRRLEEIKIELAKLDNDLAVDVAILRKQIDDASVHFTTIEKQYIKIEAQFLRAKMDLHNASEKKELLTEHLCTVITHNEDRKAKKLTELMEKVGLDTSGDSELSQKSTFGQKK